MTSEVRRDAAARSAPALWHGRCVPFFSPGIKDRSCPTPAARGAVPWGVLSEGRPCMSGLGCLARRRSTGRAGLSRWPAFLGLCLISAGASAGCSHGPPPDAPPEPPAVPVSRPVGREVTDYVDFTGRTQAV